MSERVSGTEIRMWMVRNKVTQEEFAKRCSLSVEDLRDELSLSVVSDGLIEAYKSISASSCRMVGGETPSRAEKLHETKTPCAELKEGCIFGPSVPNDRLQIVIMPDGGRVKARKKANFLPKYGMPCEVEESEEDGFVVLVGSYRNNGVRLK